MSLERLVALYYDYVDQNTKVVLNSDDPEKSGLEREQEETLSKWNEILAAWRFENDNIVRQVRTTNGALSDRLERVKAWLELHENASEF